MNRLLFIMTFLTSDHDETCAVKLYTGSLAKRRSVIASFEKCDSEKDYETAWEFFSKQQEK